MIFNKHFLKYSKIASSILDRNNGNERITRISGDFYRLNQSGHSGMCGGQTICNSGGSTGVSRCLLSKLVKICGVELVVDRGT